MRRPLSGAVAACWARCEWRGWLDARLQSEGCVRSHRRAARQVHQRGTAFQPRRRCRRPCMHTAGGRQAYRVSLETELVGEIATVGAQARAWRRRTLSVWRPDNAEAEAVQIAAVGVGGWSGLWLAVVVGVWMATLAGRAVAGEGQGRGARQGARQDRGVLWRRWRRWSVWTLAWQGRRRKFERRERRRAEKALRLEQEAKEKVIDGSWHRCLRRR
jgi:hypothetical protein